MSTSDLLGNAGPKQHITLADGRTWFLSKITQGMKAEFCAHLLERMEEVLERRAAAKRKKAREVMVERDRLRDLEEHHTTPLEDSRRYGLQREDLGKEIQALEFDAQAMERDFAASEARGDYEFFGVESLKAQACPSGAYFICWLMMRDNHPELTLDEVTAMFQHSEQQSVRLTRKVLSINGNIRDYEKNGDPSPSTTESMETTSTPLIPITKPD